jgi:hypothetical protein
VYEKYGIGEGGVIMIVRPDGYVSVVATMDQAVHAVEEFMSKFLV